MKGQRENRTIARSMRACLVVSDCGSMDCSPLGFSVHGTFQVSREYVISSVLSCHNKNLKRQTNVKALGQMCHSSGTDQCYSSVLQLSFI